MSAAATPWARSVAVTRATASLASASADPTDDPLTWTPIARTNWLGIPVTLPVPVTVMRADPAVEAITVGPAPADPRPADDAAAASPWLLPSANAPIRTAAAIPPTTSARWVGVKVMPMAGLRLCEVRVAWTRCHGPRFHTASQPSGRDE